MDIGPRLRQLREEKGMSQTDIEEITGLHRTYVSRVENSHILPSLETLERFAAALDVTMYRLLYTAGSPRSSANGIFWKNLEELAQSNGQEGANARFLLKLKSYANKIQERDRDVLLALAEKLATPARTPACTNSREQTVRLQSPRPNPPAEESPRKDIGTGKRLLGLAPTMTREGHRSANSAVV